MTPGRGGGASDVGGGGGGASLVGGGRRRLLRDRLRRLGDRLRDGRRLLAGGRLRCRRWRRFRRRRRRRCVSCVTVVDDGDGVLSLLRSTNHTANAIARSTRTRPAISRPNGRPPRRASYGSVSGSNCICGRGAAHRVGGRRAAVVVRVGRGDDDRERRRPQTRPTPTTRRTPRRPGEFPAPSGWPPPRRPLRWAGSTASAKAVAPSSAVPRAALRPPPIADVSSGCGVVMTGTPKCSDSVVVMSGMRAPPPADATAASPRAPLRSSVSCSAPANSLSGCRIASSSSLRVSRTSPRCPGSSATSEVAAVVDSRSLAARHWLRSLLSGPIAEVPVTSTDPASDSPCQDLRQHRLVDQVTGQFGVPDRLADRFAAVGGVEQRDARPAAAEVAQGDRARWSAGRDRRAAP